MVKEMITIWLVLFSRMISSLQPERNTTYQCLPGHEVPWDSGPLAAAIVLSLAGQPVEPRLEISTAAGGASLANMRLYFEGRGLQAVGFNLTWEQTLLFLSRFANRPLLAHRYLEQGYYAVLLGFVEGFLLVADPSRGVQAVPPRAFLEHFSGFVLHFPKLEALSTVAKILAAAKQRLTLYGQSVAEF